MKNSSRMKMVLGFAMLCVVSCASGAAFAAPAAPAAPPAQTVVLRGTLKWGSVNELAYVADSTTFQDASVGGVSAADLMSFRGDRLQRQAAIYRAAQLAAGVKPDKVLPLYVLIDPASDWAFGQPWASFSYVKDGRKVGPVSAPVLIIGEKMTLERGAASGLPEVAEVNRRYLEAAGRFYDEAVARARKDAGAVGTRTAAPPRPFSALKEGRYLVSSGGGPTRELTLEQLGAEWSPRSFMDTVRSCLRGELERTRLDVAAELARLDGTPEVVGLVAEGAKVAGELGLAETVCHELGHLIHFSALGLYGYKGWGSAAHMNGSNHSMTTLSTEKFAFIEGWAESNSMVLIGLPKESVPGEANRVDYDGTAGYVRYRRNEVTAKAVARVLTELKVLPAGRQLEVPSLWDAHEGFMAGVKKSALAAGLTEGQWSQVLNAARATPEVGQYERLDAYLQSLAAEKGKLRRRYDFLRSEYAVGNVLAQLRTRMGEEATGLVLKTMASRKCETLAQLVEAFVHDQPTWKVRVYQYLAEVTEGILVTRAQAEYVAAQEQAGRPLEIDVDRDGAVPGRSANAENAALFPAEPPPVAGAADPLGAGAGAAGQPVARPDGRDLVAVPVERPRFVGRGELTVVPVPVPVPEVHEAGPASRQQPPAFDGLVGPPGSY